MFNPSSLYRGKDNPAMVSKNTSLAEEIHFMVLRGLTGASFSLLPMHQREEFCLRKYSLTISEHAVKRALTSVNITIENTKCDFTL